MTALPNYAGGTIRHTVAACSTANTNRDGSGTIVSLLQAGAGGTRIDAIELVATGVTTVGNVKLFTSTNGSTWNYWTEVSVSAYTPSATVLPWSNRTTLRTTIGDPEPVLLLGANEYLGFAPHNAEQFKGHAFGADF